MDITREHIMFIVACIAEANPEYIEDNLVKQLPKETLFDRDNNEWTPDKPVAIYCVNCAQYIGNLFMYSFGEHRCPQCNNRKQYQFSNGFLLSRQWSGYSSHVFHRLYHTLMGWVYSGEFDLEAWINQIPAEHRDHKRSTKVIDEAFDKAFNLGDLL